MLDNYHWFSSNWINRMIFDHQWCHRIHFSRYFWLGRGVDTGIHTARKVTGRSACMYYNLLFARCRGDWSCWIISLVLGYPLLLILSFSNWGNILLFSYGVWGFSGIFWDCLLVIVRQIRVCRTLIMQCQDFFGFRIYSWIRLVEFLQIL